MPLVKLLLNVSSAVAQPVGECLIKLGAGGVEEQETEGGSRLVVYGEKEGELAALAERAQVALEDLGMIASAGELDWHIEVDSHSDWETAWTRYLIQQPLTPNWVIQPEWDSTPAPPGKGRILIRPMLAFGDGGHATTRLASQAVERFCRAEPGSIVLDIGTGTGVLAMIAALSGALRVVGTDIDPVAVDAARENAKLNGLLERVAFQDITATLPSGFSLVVANLEPQALLEAKADIASHARGARELILSGFLAEQAMEVSQAFLSLGLVERARLTEEGWCLLVLSPK